MDEKDKPRYSAPAVEKALNILEFMAMSNQSYTVTEIANKLSISINSVFRIMVELEKSNYVEKSLQDSSYELTSKLYFLGSSLKNRISFVDEARSTMSKIRKITNETVLLTQLEENGKTRILDQHASPLPIKFLSTVGLLYDSYCSAMGKCMLAYSSEDVIEDYISSTQFIKFTPTTIVDKDEFRAELLKIKENGVAFDNEESVPGLTCMACPIFKSGGILVGAIGISAISFRITPLVLSNYTKVLQENCKLLSNKMGCIKED
jgi:DNA-binding IclR family transcriptional regulator